MMMIRAGDHGDINNDALNTNYGDKLPTPEKQMLTMAKILIQQPNC